MTDLWLRVPLAFLADHRPTPLPHLRGGGRPMTRLDDLRTIFQAIREEGRLGADGRSVEVHGVTFWPDGRIRAPGIAAEGQAILAAWRVLPEWARERVVEVMRREGPP